MNFLYFKSLIVIGLVYCLQLVLISGGYAKHSSKKYTLDQIQKSLDSSPKQITCDLAILYLNNTKRPLDSAEQQLFRSAEKLLRQKKNADLIVSSLAHYSVKEFDLALSGLLSDTSQYLDNFTRFSFLIKAIRTSGAAFCRHSLAGMIKSVGNKRITQAVKLSCWAVLVNDEPLTYRHEFIYKLWNDRSSYLRLESSLAFQKTCQVLIANSLKSPDYAVFLDGMISSSYLKLIKARPNEIHMHLDSMVIQGLADRRSTVAFACLGQFMPCYGNWVAQILKVKFRDVVYEAPWALPVKSVRYLKVFSAINIDPGTLPQYMNNERYQALKPFFCADSSATVIKGKNGGISAYQRISDKILQDIAGDYGFRIRKTNVAKSISRSLRRYDAGYVATHIDLHLLQTCLTRAVVESLVISGKLTAADAKSLAKSLVRKDLSNRALILSVVNQYPHASDLAVDSAYEYLKRLSAFAVRPPDVRTTLASNIGLSPEYLELYNDHAANAYHSKRALRVVARSLDLKGQYFVERIRFAGLRGEYGYMERIPPVLMQVLTKNHHFLDFSDYSLAKNDLDAKDSFSQPLLSSALDVLRSDPLNSISYETRFLDSTAQVRSTAEIVYSENNKINFKAWQKFTRKNLNYIYGYFGAGTDNIGISTVLDTITKRTLNSKLQLHFGQQSAMLNVMDLNDGILKSTPCFQVKVATSDSIYDAAKEMYNKQLTELINARAQRRYLNACLAEVNKLSDNRDDIDDLWGLIWHNPNRAKEDALYSINTSTATNNAILAKYDEINIFDLDIHRVTALVPVQTLFSKDLAKSYITYILDIQGQACKIFNLEVTEPVTPEVSGYYKSHLDFFEKFLIDLGGLTSNSMGRTQQLISQSLNETYGVYSSLKLFQSVGCLYDANELLNSAIPDQLISGNSTFLFNEENMVKQEILIGMNEDYDKFQVVPGAEFYGLLNQYSAAVSRKIQDVTDPMIREAINNINGNSSKDDWSFGLFYSTNGSVRIFFNKGGRGINVGFGGGSISISPTINLSGKRFNIPFGLQIQPMTSS